MDSDFLKLISEGQLAKKEGELEEFLSKHPSMRKHLVTESVSDPAKPEDSPSGDFSCADGVFEHYLTHLENKFGGNKKAKDQIEKIKDTIESTARRMENRQPTAKRSGYGLVIGRIQSGKTAHMFGLTMRSIDSGPSHENACFDTVIVLSGLTNDLRLQTRDRIIDALDGFQNAPQILPPREVDLKEADDSETKDRITSHLDSPKSPLLIVIKKNHRVLGHLLDSIHAADQSKIRSRSVLIIDDEADHASIDTSESDHDEVDDEVDDDPSETNRQLRIIIKKFAKSRKCWYIGYTATPFANLLIAKGINDPPNEHGLSLHPRDFLHALPKPDRHLDNEQYFMVPDSPHVLIKNPVISLSDEEREEIRSVVLRHLLTSRVKRNRGIDGHHTTLIHTSTKRDQHKRLAELVRSIIDDLKDGGRAHLTSKTLRELLDDYKGSLDKEDYEAASDFIQLDTDPRFNRFTDLIGSVVVAEVNSRPRDEGEYSPADLDYSQTRSYIAVGGTRLSRGLTLEGLTTSWFSRRAVNPRYDTMLQMARWCGYRVHFDPPNPDIDYSDLVRIITTEQIRQDFLTIGNEESNLRTKIEALPEDANPEEEVIWIREHPGLHITAPEKMQDVQWRSWGGVKKSVIWSFHSPILGEDAIQIAPKLYDEAARLIRKIQSVKSDKAKGFEVFTNIKSKWVFEFLEFYSELLGKCGTSDDLTRLREVKSGYPHWNVAIHLPKNKKQTKKIFKLDIGLVNRSRDEIVGDRLKVVQNSHADTFVDIGAEQPLRETPLLLLYLVDPASTQNGDGVVRVFPKGVKTPVPIFGISLPTGSANEGGMEAAAGE